MLCVLLLTSLSDGGVLRERQCEQQPYEQLR